MRKSTSARDLGLDVPGSDASKSDVCVRVGVTYVVRIDVAKLAHGARPSRHPIKVNVRDFDGDSGLGRVGVREDKNAGRAAVRRGDGHPSAVNDARLRESEGEICGERGELVE